MNNTMTMTLCALLAAAPAMANSELYRSIVGDAANVERTAAAINQGLKPKRFDATQVKADIERLGQDISKLRSAVESFQADSLTGKQAADWELVKTKVQLLTIFHDRKSELAEGDFAKHRSLLRAHAKGIAERARRLQETANRLDR